MVTYLRRTPYWVNFHAERYVFMHLPRAHRPLAKRDRKHGDIAGVFKRALAGIGSAHVTGISRDIFSFDFGGRVRRRNYWLGLLVSTTLIRLGNELVGWPLAVAGVALTVVGVWLEASLLVRRLHDFDQSGWWAVPILAPPVTISIAIVFLDVFFPATAAGLVTERNGLILIGMAFTQLLILAAIGFVPGLKEDNDFGPDPKGLIARFAAGSSPPY